MPPRHSQREIHPPQANRLVVPPSRAEITAHRTTPQQADLSADPVRLTDLPARLTIIQAAAFLKIPAILAYRAAEIGDLPMVHHGGPPMIDTAQLLVDLGVPTRQRENQRDDCTPGRHG